MRRQPGDRIKGIGPLNARIVVIGEAPMKQEDFEGRPFAGGGYNLMRKLWEDAGIDKYQVRLENLHESRAKYDKIDSVPTGELVDSIKNLHQRLAKMERPYVLVPTGNYSTFALTGKGKVKAALRKQFGEEINTSKAEKKANINVLRGSTYIYVDPRSTFIFAFFSALLVLISSPNCLRNAAFTFPLPVNAKIE